MAKQSFIWTALPNGFTQDGESVRVSGLLSPRLDPEGNPQELSTFFPDWKDWPTTLAKATFEVSYNGNTVSIPANMTSGPNRVDITLGTPDLHVWRSLFKGDMIVKRFEYKDMSNNLVLSYDTMHLSSIVRKLYSKLAESANGNMPVVSDIMDDPDWQDLVTKVENLDLDFINQDTGLRDVNRQFEMFFEYRLTRRDDKTAETLARFQLFHTPTAKPTPVTQKRSDDERIEAKWMEYSRHDMPKPKELVEMLDFHQIVAAMNSYPTILRKLGLVVDFIIDADEFGQSQDKLLSISVTFPPGALRVPTAKRSVSLGTHTMLSASKFQAVPNSSPKQDDLSVVDRLLDMNLKRCDLIQEDIDGAGLKLMNFARTLAKLRPDSSRIDNVTRFEKELGVPSLRNEGLALVHHNRWSMLENKFETNTKLNNAAKDLFDDKISAMPDGLWAEDILRGFRIDIWDLASAKWRSLCERTATYLIGDGKEVKVEKEETTVRLGATKSADPDVNQDLVCLHEALVTWTGWSVGAPPPGRAVKPDGSVDKSSAQTDAVLPPGLKFKTIFKPVVGSLPRLRYGRHYWMRARAVDLAGNSLPSQEQDIGPEHPQENKRMYCRYEPVAAPIIALVKQKSGKTENPAEGESMERIAIRSFNSQPSDSIVPTDQVGRRFAVPPQTSVREAELHGMLDAAGKLDKSKFDMLANQKDLDPTTDKENAALVEEIIATKGPLGEALVDTTFAVYKDGEALTYLPDPMAKEVSARIFDHPGMPDTEIIKIPLYPQGKWPEAQPFKIQVYEMPGSIPKYDTATHTLLIPLPKAVRAKVRLSMRLSEDSLAKMGIWNWITSKKDKLEMALNGQHWMLTPWRTVEVVHAVQKPLISPEMSKLTIQREHSRTYVRPAFIATCSITSTDRLDLLSEWHEPRDEPSSESEVDLKRGDVAFHIKVVDPKSYSLKIFGQTQGGFSDHMIIGDDLINVNMIEDHFAPTKKHEFHDTRYRRIEYWLEGTTRFREYMSYERILTEPGTKIPTDKNIKVTGRKFVTWIPSSAPPPAPSLLYVIPTFGWVRTTDDEGNKYSMRRGRGLRVYLDRPWNVSGYGEMLAVLLLPPSFSGNPDEDPKGHPYKNYVTQWGNDPIWLSPFVSGMSPRRTDFPLARTVPDSEGKWLPKNAPPEEKDQPPGQFVVTGLSLQGMSTFENTYALEIAPHDVFYDEERRLWYCDIEINNGSAYYPSVRLALARYQPVSVQGAHLSNAVLADFMPLAADRWLNVTRTANEKVRRITVYGSKYTDSAAHVEAKKSPSMSIILPITQKRRTLVPAEVSPISIFEVWLEHLNDDLGEDFGWERITKATAKPATLQKKAVVKPVRRKALAGELMKERKFDVLLRKRLVESVFALQPLYNGEITLPAMQGERYRLMIAEYEEYLVDDDRPYDDVPEKKDRRLVFVEHVEL